MSTDRPAIARQEHDLLGRPLSADERELLDLYHRLEALASRNDLPPCALMNCKQAMVMLWNACVDLDLLYEEPGVD
ncbi:MAG TPA: hypothetical protein VK081_04750 [Planctomycetota bacterium]|nr:hypothetical protein [Planctomycetota bacterium]